MQRVIKQNGPFLFIFIVKVISFIANTGSYRTIYV